MIREFINLKINQPRQNQKFTVSGFQIIPKTLKTTYTNKNLSQTGLLPVEHHYRLRF